VIVPSLATKVVEQQLMSLMDGARGSYRMPHGIGRSVRRVARLHPESRDWLAWAHFGHTQCPQTSILVNHK
jgi:hypothetical protein